MKALFSTVAAVAVFKFAFKASWKIALLAGAATYLVTGGVPLVWEKKDEKL